MSDKFEKTFEFVVPVERLWRAFTDRTELDAWYPGQIKDADVRPGGRITWPMGEFDYVWEFVEVEPNRRLTWKEPPGLLPGETEVTAVFEQTGTGSRVRITQSGFGEGEDWLGQLESWALGWSQNLANLYLYLRTGVGFDRFFTWKSETGVTVTDTPAGPEVLVVKPGSFAEQAGVRVGDIVVQVGAAPVFGQSDLWVLEREHEPGEELEAMYVRGDKLLRGRGVLGAFGA
ncbi:uncharacterized protein YndB with AHSA1/START domain [Thermocatellispora tengchongensis]|uniref:Uncharacterized protein YndB with AHSA1/START domain n=1 Tax=Thermocatellispora tengchongensis TaxID=1073253 RepID=A0A840P8M6_9ACTN|nr:SRPBCC domain-containing protein [Thermocatellispora tengchongensis]MBB5135642.1 uncharacterized protein YndB with AHSA1/START domain [Thermocatellispora tengchongensis]